MNNSQEIILAQISAIYDKPPFVKVKTGQMEMILKCVGLGKYYDEYAKYLEPYWYNRGFQNDIESYRIFVGLNSIFEDLLNAHKGEEIISLLTELGNHIQGNILCDGGDFVNDFNRLCQLYNLMGLQIVSTEIDEYSSKFEVKPYLNEGNHIIQSFGMEQWLKNKYQDVYQSKNVVLSGLNILEKSPNYLNQKFDFNSLTKTRRLVEKYIKIKPEIQAIVDREFFKLHIDNCVGLYLRGTDYTKLKPAGHPIQPTTFQAVKKIDEYMLQHPQKKIFLVTEDMNIYTDIKKKYDDNVYTINGDVYITDYDGKTFLSEDKALKQLGRSSTQRGITYLVKIILLSKCRDLIGGNTSGSWAACVFSKSFNYMYIFDLGKY